MKSYTVNVAGSDFLCTEFFDVDRQVEGIDISLNGKHIAELFGYYIPDENCDLQEAIDFEDAVTDLLNDEGY